MILATKFIPKKCAILLIEFQNEFATEGGKIYGQVQNLSSKIEYCWLEKELPWTTASINFVRFHEILNQTEAEKFTCLS